MLRGRVRVRIPGVAIRPDQGGVGRAARVRLVRSWEGERADPRRRRLARSVRELGRPGEAVRRTWDGGQGHGRRARLRSRRAPAEGARRVRECRRGIPGEEWGRALREFVVRRRDDFALPAVSDYFVLVKREKERERASEREGERK